MRMCTARPGIDWPDISYHGLILRHDGERKIGFIAVNGASYFVMEGEVLIGLKIGKISKECIEIFRGEERLVVRK